MKVTLWVVLDDQWGDAQAVMHDPEHRVLNALSEEEMQAMRAQVKNVNQASIHSFTQGALIGGILLLVALVVLFAMVQNH